MREVERGRISYARQQVITRPRQGVITRPRQKIITRPHQPVVTRPRQPVITRPLPAPPPPRGPDPELIARAHLLLRLLERATTALTDALDISGFPERERQSQLALLSTVASGLPPVTLEDLIESLHQLAVVHGPSALYPDAEPQLSLPDEAREILYIVEPVAALAQLKNRLPRHAGLPLRAAPLTFSLTQAKTAAAFDDVLSLLRQLVGLPLRQPTLTTLREPRLAMSEPTGAVVAIMLCALLLAITLVGLIAIVATNPLLPFELGR
ncbi:MAG TPA: hypothetical protein VF510_24165 [Ktedonobacterales bacterium]